LCLTGVQFPGWVVEMELLWCRGEGGQVEVYKGRCPSEGVLWIILLSIPTTARRNNSGRMSTQFLFFHGDAKLALYRCFPHSLEFMLYEDFSCLYWLVMVYRSGFILIPKLCVWLRLIQFMPWWVKDLSYNVILRILSDSTGRPPRFNYFSTSLSISFVFGGLKEKEERKEQNLG
jgi:hypothetical protein